MLRADARKAARGTSMALGSAMKVLLLALFLMILTSCKVLEISPSEAQAVQAAQAFVARNGYSSSGHPNNLPVQHVEIFDGIASDAELIEQRRGMLEPNAIGIEDKGQGAYWVYFATTGRSDHPRIVVVEDGKAWQVFHQSYGPPGPQMKRIPRRPVTPNKTMEPTR